MTSQSAESGIPSVPRRVSLFDGTFGRQIDSRAPKSRFSTSDTTKPNSTSPGSRPHESQRPEYTDGENEEAWTNIWSIYVTEAERYDSALVKSWKADMEGMLIFSGLFSASLTAFLIESYKSLQPDSGALTVAALSEVSRQLAAMATGDELSPVQIPEVFHPPGTALLCNCLWFISLALSLTCALLATLVEQWAREFLHKADMRPSPIRRARVFSFLYFGLKHFRMHTVVDIIPFLLHSALLLFFAGLVVFLIHVNQVLMFLMTSVLVLFLLLYTLLTVLPVIYPDCPYRTPLAGVFWSFLQKFRRILSPETHLETRTLSDRVLAHAMVQSEDRDQRALRWTLECLTDDTELLPFIEAIPDGIYGQKGFRRTKDTLFIHLLGDWRTPSPLVARICNFIANTGALRGDDPLSLQRERAGLKCLWALSMMPVAREMRFDISNLAFLFQDPGKHPLRITAQLALQYHDQQWCRNLLSNLRDLINNYPTIGEVEDSSRDFKRRTLPLIRRQLQLIFHYLGTELFPRPVAVLREFSSTNRGVLVESFFQSLNTLRALSTEIQVEDTAQTASWLEQIQCAIDVLCESPVWNSYRIGMVTAWLEKAFQSVNCRLFEPLLTSNEILAGISVCPPIRNLHLPRLEQALSQDFFREGIHEVDVLMRIAFRLLVLSPAARLDSHVEYLCFRNYQEALVYAIQDCDKTQLSTCLTDHLRRYQDSLPEDHAKLDRLIHGVAILVSIYPSYEAVKLADEVLRGKDALHPDSPYATVRTMKTLRDLEQLIIKIVEISHRCSPRRTPVLNQASMTAVRSSLQDICGHPVLRPHCPLFLPDNIDLTVVCESIQIEILNQYLRFVGSFLKHCMLRPQAEQVSANVFHLLRVTELAEGNHFSTLWGRLDPEAQGIFSAAALSFIRHIVHDVGPLNPMKINVAQEMWKSSIFWVASSEAGEGYLVNAHLVEMEGSCIKTLIEALILYKDSGGTEGPSINTAFSDQVLGRLKSRI
ncbi:hypothetical protein DFH09DRAFT_1282850 [Mycena vulgaris]|nr:hypothetical protein DFH09DRAFT_1282850 [Mycena vulgaris]